MNINIKLIILIIFLLFIISFSSSFLFIPVFIIYYFLNLQNIIYLIKNIYWSSISFLFYLFNIKLYVNSLNLFEDLTNNLEEQNIIICNHIAEFDFIIMSFIINNIKNYFYFKTNYFLKKSIGYKIMGVGIIGLFSNDIFLDRDIIKDFKKISTKNNSNLIFIFPEGTCYNDKNKIISDNYCNNNNLPIFKYHLYPKITGIKTLLNNNKITNIYDLTVVYNSIDKKEYGLIHSIYKYLFRQDFPSKIFLEINKYKISKNEDISKKIEFIYNIKDNFIKKFDINKNKFIPIKYNFYNGFVNLYLIINITIVSYYLFYNYPFIKYLYFIQSIFYYIFFYLYG